MKKILYLFRYVYSTILLLACPILLFRSSDLTITGTEASPAEPLSSKKNIFIFYIFKAPCKGIRDVTKMFLQKTLSPTVSAVICQV